MKKNEIFKTSDEYTKEELEDICSILLISISSLTDRLVDNKISLLKCNDYIKHEKITNDIAYNERCLSSIKKLHDSIFKVLMNGGNIKDEM